MGEAQFVDKRVVGFLDNRVFHQDITARHIFRQYQAKGMDMSLYRALKGKNCKIWELRFQDTKQVLAISFDQMEKVGFEVNTGSGKQMMVRLKEFSEKEEAKQRHLL